MNTIDKTNQFLIFCLENYKIANKQKGESALSDFKKYNVFEFLKSGYEVLHTQSKNYIISEINTYIANRK